MHATEPQMQEGASEHQDQSLQSQHCPSGIGAPRVAFSSQLSYLLKSCALLGQGAAQFPATLNPSKAGLVLGGPVSTPGTWLSDVSLILVSHLSQSLVLHLLQNLGAVPVMGSSFLLGFAESNHHL